MSQSSSFSIHINESGNILDEIEKTLKELNLEGYTLSSKYKKRIDFGTYMLTATVRMADEEDKAFFKAIYNLNNITVRCSMDVLKSIATIEHYKDACKIVAGLMNRFPGDCVFTDLHEDDVLIRFSGDVIVSERCREVNSGILLLNELENIPSISILNEQEKVTLTNEILTLIEQGRANSLDTSFTTETFNLMIDELEKYPSFSILNEQEKDNIGISIFAAIERADLSKFLQYGLEKYTIPYRFEEIHENEDPDDIL